MSYQINYRIILWILNSAVALPSLIIHDLHVELMEDDLSTIDQGRCCAAIQVVSILLQVSKVSYQEENEPGTKDLFRTIHEDL